ncbi:MaoC family dehydratase [Amycolatopsis alba]|uniref:Acyl dehydratase n=1 Tax=Amycolatopsis alba DSM 44262 TaxID=1125972 RepID=A0A229RT45_AMYAL|nr:MaoC family dehydratase [Amycolatopsis alba]OXM49681.1 acyl dehydratase [Amycolatopsis alba DSM 44262]
MSEPAEKQAFATPIDQRYFEDYIPGTTYEFGSASLTEAQIIEFAKEYDPQSFHVDPAAAANGPFAGLIASGWQTSALMMRLFAQYYLSSVASLGGPGVDELRWLRPVRSDDRLRLRVTVVDTKVSNSKPDRGLVRTLAELIDDADRPVFKATILNFLLLREREA